MGIHIEHLEEGVVFCGHYLEWGARDEAVRRVADAVAAQARCGSSAIAWILRFELVRDRRR